MSYNRLFEVCILFVVFFCFTVISITGSGISRCIASELMISDVKIVIDETNDVRKWQTMATKLILCKKGSLFSRKDIDDSLTALKRSKKFHRIHVDSAEDEKGIMLIFKLTPSYLIKDIKISGGFPIFEREILNAMTIYAGDAYFKEDVEKQNAIIKALFLKEGFIAPDIQIKAVQDRKDGFYMINIDIKKGDYYSLKSLDFNGNQAFSDLRLKLQLKTFTSSILPGSSSRFVESALKKDKEKLIAFYRKHGYARADIDYKVDKKPDTKRAYVSFTIVEGPQYKIEIKGYDAFWGFTLKKDIVFKKSGDKNGLGIKKSVRNMKKRYKEAGFHSVRIRTDEKQSDGGAIKTVSFLIAEGPRSIVNSVEISGNNFADDEKIKKQILTRVPGFLYKGQYVPDILRQDIVSIQSFYLSNGYMNSDINKRVQLSADKKNANVFIDINEGVRTIVRSVKIENLTVIDEKDAFKSMKLKKGEPFRNYMITSDENSLSAIIAEKGYPHVEVKGEVRFNKNNAFADLIYKVETGPPVTMGKIYYTGNFKTRQKILDNEMELEPGKPFSLVKMLKSKQKIQNIGAFKSVQFKAFGIERKEDEIDLFVEIEEQKPYFIQIGGGYDTERHLFVHGKVGDRNLFGANMNGWVGAVLSETGYRADMGITEPRLFGSKISASFGLYAEKIEEFNQDFGTKSYGASLGLDRLLTKHLRTGLGFRFERREQFEKDADDTDTKNYDPEEFDARNILVTTPSISYDTRDSYLKPTKGIFSSFSVDISKGLDNSLDDFFKYRFDFRYYTTPFSRLTLAMYGRTGYIDLYGSSDNVPEDQLFFLGGTSDVRGFKENRLTFDSSGDPTGGRSATSASLEARIDLGKKFELTTFYDIGEVAETGNNDEDSGFRSSAGVGIRYITPIGPVGLLYGFKLDKKDGEDSGRLHFALGYTF